jgi:DNA-binding NtrC family response regulator
VVKTILVVDDESDTRVLLYDLLSSEGFKVVTFENPQEALHRVQDVKPDLVILDLRMPMMSGMKLLPMLQIAAPHARVMILSAYADPKTSQDALTQGVAAVLWKPFKTATLLRTIRRILDMPEPRTADQR